MRAAIFTTKAGSATSSAGRAKISLATVRRLAVELPHVVSAKTLIFKHADGSEDFDLELRVNGSALGSGERPDASAMLGTILRRTEMPRAIRVEPANEMDGQRYK
jgi:hypothetical protein